ncbi:hypothetical protein AXE65_07200 [Ventosimonas gracilis]|uniref:Uncharacterized protein n=1 Tax=Ventosimonas gracilis TaxID=1680762 RepID=A0A139SIN9_9GAMM|nr:DUF1315 family protein [Ventosimonas gracilis]KXU34448.1 hypothetical protein AXE65_07200 [Ventosimonas gracilis]
MTDFLQMIETINADIYERLKLAVEIGKWPDGQRLTQEQKELCLQALITWEAKNLPIDARIGYMGEQHCKSKAKTIPNLLLHS